MITCYASVPEEADPGELDVGSRTKDTLQLPADEVRGISEFINETLGSDAQDQRSVRFQSYRWIEQRTANSMRIVGGLVRI